MRQFLTLSILTLCILISGCGGGSDTPEKATTQTTKFTVTAASNEGGSISPESVTVEQGGSYTFALTTEQYYSIDSVEGCPAGSLTNSEYVVSNVQGNCTLNVVFKYNNQVPFVTAIDDFTITPGVVTNVSAAISDVENEIATITWQQLSGDTVVFTGGDTDEISFTAPNEWKEAKILTFQVTAIDQAGLENSDTVTVTVDPVANLISPQVISASDSGSGIINLVWYDEEYPLGNAKYNIYADLNDNFSIEPANLLKQVNNQNEALITGLEQGQTYFFKVARVEQSTIVPSASFSHETSLTNTVLAPNVVTVTPESNAIIAVEQTTEEDFTLSINDKSTLPEVNEIFIGETDEGKSFLKRVKTVSTSGDTATITTEPVTIGEITTDFSLSSSLDMKTISNNQAAKASKSSTTTSPISNYRSSKGSLRLFGDNQAANHSQRQKQLLTEIKKSAKTAVVSRSVEADKCSGIGYSQTTRNGVSLCGPDVIDFKAGTSVNVSYVIEGLTSDYSFTVEKRSKVNKQCATTSDINYSISGNSLELSHDKLITGDSPTCNYILIIRLKSEVDNQKLVDKQLKIYVNHQDNKSADKVTSTHSSGATLEMELLHDFDPHLTTNVELKRGQIQKAEVYAQLDFALMATASFNAFAQANFEKEKELYTKTWIKVIPGPPPIYQRITLSVDAIVTGSIDAEINAQAIAQAASQVTFGVKYCYDGSEINQITNQNCVSGEFFPVADADFSHSITVSAKGEANAQAEVRLIPRIDVSFYEVVTGSLTLEPYLNADIGAEVTADMSFLDGIDNNVYQYQLNNLNVNLGLDVFAGVSLDLFVKEFNPVPFQRFYNKNFPLYSLPTLSVERSDSEKVADNIKGIDGFWVDIKGKVIDEGVNNEFTPESVSFDIVPRDNIIFATDIITDEATQEYSQRVWLPIEGNSDATFDVYFSGWGKLGALARRYTSSTISVGTDEDKDGMPDEWEKQYLSESIPYFLFFPDADEDNDGLKNIDEYTLGSNPTLWDTDYDCLPDGWEVTYNLDLLSENHNEDPDSDGLSNLSEYLGSNKSNLRSGHVCSNFNASVIATPNPSGANWLAFNAPDLDASNPQNSDSDGDGLPDGWEAQYNLGFTARLAEDNSSTNSDSDSLSDLDEYSLGTNPTQGDTDSDSLPDDWEVTYGLNPRDANESALDPDRDGLTNLQEYNQGNNPKLIDLTLSYTGDRATINLSWQPYANSKYSILAYRLTRYPAFNPQENAGVSELTNNEEIDGTLYVVDTLNTSYSDTAPILTEDVLTYSLQVLFTDGVNITADSIAINIEELGDANTPPVANAGEDQTVAELTPVALNGTGSTDQEDGPSLIPLNYTWLQTDATGIIITLDNEKIGNPTFTAPEIDEQTVLTFELTVTDSQLLTSTDTVEITIIPATADLEKGLVAYYPFNGNANDLSQNSNNGIENGGITYVAGIDGQAVSFDGIDDYITVAHSKELILNHFSIGLWFKSNLNNFDKDHISIMNKGGWGTDEYGENTNYTISYKQDMFWSGFEQSDGTNQIITFQKENLSSDWNYVNTTYDGQTLKTYINGKLFSTLNTNGAIPSTSIHNLAFGINGNPNYYQNVFYKGYIDEVRVYNRALNQAEITELSTRVINNAPKFTDITPKTVISGTSGVTFTVTGESLPETLAMALEHSDTCSAVSVNSVGTAATITCDIPDTELTQLEFYVKDKPGAEGGDIITGASNLTINIIQSEIAVANTFDYPLGNKGIDGNGAAIEFSEQLSIELNSAYETQTGIVNNHRRSCNGVDTDCSADYVSSSWRNAQDVGSYYSTYTGLHPGEDWNKGSGDKDAGEPVYAVANGELFGIRSSYSSPQKGAWTIVIKHTLQDSSEIYSVYTHVTASSELDGSISLNTDSFSLPQAITKGQMIGRIAKGTSSVGGMTLSPSHLHFELRNKSPGTISDLWHTNDGYANGYFQTANDSASIIAGMISMQNLGIIDPSDFIKVHRTGTTIPNNNIVLGVTFADEAFAACVQEHVTVQASSALADLTLLDCSNRNIANVSELSYMTGLISLDLHDNPIVEINLDANQALNTVNLQSTNLSQTTVDYLATVNWVANLNYPSYEPPQGDTSSFNTVWRVEDNQLIRIPIHPDYDYNYTVDWGDGSAITTETGEARHQYSAAGDYTIKITGNFPAIYFRLSYESSRNAIYRVTQWGGIQWQSMSGAFYDCENLIVDAWDVPNLSSVSSMDLMFDRASAITGGISNWDVSSVTSMVAMFSNANSFEGDISNWDVSSVTNMASLFSYNRAFNGDISSWDVSSVTNMSYMFEGSAFNGDITRWDTSAVTNMGNMFSNSTAFNHDISSWDVSSVTQMRGMFSAAHAFNHDLSVWDVSSVIDMSYMFSQNSVFNGDLSDWNVSSVTNMKDMFYSNETFARDISRWDVSSVTNMSGMFWGARKFNANIANWDVSAVTDMSYMLSSAKLFDGDLSSWNVSNVADMSSMFSGASVFNSDISSWDVSSVVNMHGLFNSAYLFNQDLSSWDVSSVNGMRLMFSNAISFNGDLTSWDVSAVTNMNRMFSNAISFNGDLTSWDVSNVTEHTNFSTGSLVIEPLWDQQPQGDTSSFNTIWLVTEGQQITIPTYSASGYAYNYQVDWGDDSAITTETGDASHTYSQAGTYTVKITGIFPAIYFNGNNCSALQSIEQWGGIEWQSMERAFRGCSNLISSAIDTPNLESVTSMERMFYSASAFNGDLSNWDVSSVTNMTYLFYFAESFNGNISSWDVSAVTNMRNIFAGASAFNGNLSNWDTSAVTNMSGMFLSTEAFNGDLSNWDVSAVTKMGGMFYEAIGFNGDISTWDVSAVTDMSVMFFNNPTFSGDLSNWDVSSVIATNSMFQGATSFNGDLSNWDVSAVTNMNNMFARATSFNSDLSSWDVSAVTNIFGMFNEASSFNSDISTWDTSAVTNMSFMLNNASSFDGDLSNWDVSNVTNHTNFATGSSVIEPNWP